MSRVLTPLTSLRLLQSSSGPAGGSSASVSQRFYSRKPKWMDRDHFPIIAQGPSSSSSSSSSLFDNVGGGDEDLPFEQLQEEVIRKNNAEDNNNRVYSKSVWLWQKGLMSQDSSSSSSLPDPEDEVQLRRIIRGRGPLEDNNMEDMDNNVIVRIKTKKDAELVEEWVRAVKEISQTKEVKLEVAKQKMLSEMEKLKSAISLDDLDEAIEKALSSEVYCGFDANTTKTGSKCTSSGRNWNTKT